MPATRLRKLPLSMPVLAGNEWRYLKECLDTNVVSSIGPFVERFERDIARYVGARFAVATTSGTAALHLALVVAGVGPDDEVIVPALTFIAPANAVRYVGAWPVFIDVERDYWQIDPSKVADFLHRECVWQAGRLLNRRTGRRVRAILPVHLLGHPCDMNALCEIAERFELVVIEDATESLGARYKGRRVGGIGQIGCFSFNGNKVVTCGGGGMLVTNDEAVARRARYLSTQAKDDPVEYLHEEIGFNYRLTNVQAAIGCAQLEQIEGFIAAKRNLAREYAGGVAEIAGVHFMAQAPWAQSIYWLCTVLVDAKLYGCDSRALMRGLSDEGVECRPLWRPLSDLKPFRDAQGYRVECAHDLCRDALSLPSSPAMRADDVSRVLRGIAAIARH